MGDLPGQQRIRGLWLVLLAALTLGSAGAAAYWYSSRPREPEIAVASQPHIRFPLQIQLFCHACHAYPPPETFPRSAWKPEIEQAYRFFEQSHLSLQAPAMEDVIAYYESRAPLELPPAVFERAAGPLPVRFTQTPYGLPPKAKASAISNVNLVHLFDERQLDVLACDLRAGLVLALKPYAPAPAWQVLGAVSNPAHAEVVDLDGDGIKDILVADLGSLTQTDSRTGSVVWLRGSRDGRFTPITLLKDVGRVADVQAGDFRGVGKLDLVVAVFGWRNTGEVIYLENHTTDWSHPVFVPRVLDERHGAIQVPVGDLNGDGKLDFVALISQEHETVIAFLGDGKGNFHKETLYAAPHPAYDSSGIQLVDLNGDKRLDVLYTNGYSMDKPYLLKPYHGIQWLENQGRFPFVHHSITPMYGVHRAVAADFRGTGRPDIVAVGFLPEEGFPQREQQNLDAVLYLEQTAPGQFARHSLETGTCDHVTCAAGDIFGTGKIDLVTGNFMTTRTDRALMIWRNQKRLKD